MVLIAQYYTMILVVSIETESFNFLFGFEGI
uniref:Uncharacterized protein n=1 Tax=Anguilla anguilla TaxID=7936 RepID=A0A0E9RIH7_ANGAN